MSDQPAPAPSTGSDVRSVGLVLGTFAVMAALALSVAAFVFSAGNGDERASAGAPAAVAVALSEMSIDPGVITASAGATLEVANEGSIPHNLTVKGEDLATGDIAAGETAELSLSGLSPGTYTVICTISGHEVAGMTAELTVVADAGGAVAAAAPDGGGTDHSAHGGDEMDYEAMDKAMTDSMSAYPAATEGTGNQVLEPTILPDGTKRFELTAAITPWEVSPGNVVEAWTYNGMVPGPQMFAAVGDVVEIVLQNDLPLGTDMHLHGVDTPNEMDGVAPITQDLIEAGESFTYRFRARQEAVGMYHAHHHAQMTVPNGLLGMIYVGDVPLPRGRTISGRAVPEDVAVSQEIPMVLNDAGVIGYALNGKSFPATEPITGTEGDWVLIHYANEGTQIHPMHLHQMDQIVVAKDGYPLDEPYAADTINVAPGERYSVLVQLEDPGTWVWHCHILPHVETDEGMFGMVTAVVIEERG